MKYLLFFLSLSVFCGCAKHLAIDQSDFNKIPKGSKSVIVTSPLSPDSAYKFVAKYFIRNGWVVDADKELLQIAPQPKSIGVGTMLKPIVYIEPFESGSKVHYRAEWGLDQDGQIMLQAFGGGTNTTAFKPAVFEKRGTTKNDAAFQAIVVYARRVPGEISYKP